MTYLDRMTAAYLDCAAWADAEAHGIDECAPWSAAAREQARNECADFRDCCERKGVNTDGWDAEQLGHDFWLSRNRHGAGFFDRPWADADALQVLAKTYGGAYLYTNDAGEIEFGG